MLCLGVGTVPGGTLMSPWIIRMSATSTACWAASRHWTRRVGLPLTQQMSFLHLVLERRMGHAVVAAGAVDAHVTLLDRPYRVQQELAVVLAVVTPFRSSLPAGRTSSVLRVLGDCRRSDAAAVVARATSTVQHISDRCPSNVSQR